MFASENVMKDYLDQLLTDESENLEHNNNKESSETIEQSKNVQNSSADSLAESKYSAKIKQDFSNVEDLPEKNKLKLKPIERAIVADKTLPVKEPEPEVNSLEQLLLAVSMQQQEAAEALALKEEQAVAVEPIVEEKVSAVTETLTETSTETTTVSETVTDLETYTETEVETNVQVEAEEKLETTVATKSIDKIEEPFQALFFEVAGLSLAVPLHELGGIHNLEDVTSLFGKPDWFLGVMVNREKKINVVESAKWVMPEKYDSLQTKPDYKYLIMLGESNWGLAAEKLVTTEYIKPDDVKWRSQPGKRPWLLGTIKEKMCALLHVDDLVAMLNKGINARQE